MPYTHPQLFVVITIYHSQSLPTQSNQGLHVMHSLMSWLQDELLDNSRCSAL